LLGMVRENVDKVNQTTWDLIVLDEAHVIKKHTNKIYQIMLQVKATRRILLTATPIMNNLTVSLSSRMRISHTY
jgi:SNF2 family DNA or RNA helicase